jgi:hypothetical protein
MKHKNYALTLCFLSVFSSRAQTDLDGLLIKKNQLRVGVTAGSSSFKDFWAGTQKRDYTSFGRLTTTNVMLAANYGITNKINVIAALPYVRTKGDVGPNNQQEGLQDLSVTAKWAAWGRKLGKGRLTTFLIGGYSTPVSDYNPDFLPYSIGLKSQQVIGRIMADYQLGNWTVTASGSYIYRNNVTLDRDNYYTTEMYYSDEVRMPDVSYFNLRAGYRSKRWVAELIGERWNTLGGFDMSFNASPFVSNDVEATRLGFNFIYEASFLNGLSLTANGNTTLDGRNTAQSTGFNAGAFYTINFKNKKAKTPSSK